MSKKRLLKRLVPQPVQQLALRTFDSFAHRSTLNARVTHLENQLQLLQQQLQELEPPLLYPPPASEQRIIQMLAEKGFARALQLLEQADRSAAALNLSISPNDMMFRNIRHFAADVPAAYARYFEVSLNAIALMEAIVNHKFGSWSQAGNVLDFASGYGRTTRFLIHLLPPERLWISDIKERAVEFQLQQFGVPGFVSTREPEDLHIETRFNCIFVISLFSHLSQDSFSRWLQRLCDMLTDDGVIAFSVHDSSLLEPMGIPSQGEFTYLNTSEETAFRSQDERLAGTHYGSTFVSENYVRDVISNLDFPGKEYTRLPRSLSKKQDVYVLARDGFDFSTLQLNSEFSTT